MSLQVIKRDIDFVAIVRASGIDLKRSGKRHVGLCPFHGDTLPSFYIFPDGRFKCYGCGEHGDVIDFVEKFHGVDFKEALQILGVKKEKITPRRRQEINQSKRRRRLINEFRAWERSASAEVGMLCRCCRRVLAEIKTEIDLDRYAARYHDLSTFEYHLNILVGNDDEAKYQLWQSGLYE